LERDTRLVHAGRQSGRDLGIVNPPVCRASTILYPSLAAFERRFEQKYTGFPYGLYGTTTTMALAEALAELSGGARTLIASSGLAAVSQALTAFLRQGDQVLVADTVYGPTRAFCDEVLSRFGVTVTYYDPEIGAGIAGLIGPTTRVVYLESPGSQTFEVQDVPAITAAARQRGLVTILDNTWATPRGFRAFERGADVEVLALTKHVAGHSDVMLGAITTRTEALFRTVRDGASAFGDCPAPDSCYEALRGLRTLAVRMRHHEASALRVAEWLGRRPEVAAVLYPPLPGAPGHALWKRDFVGGSSLLGARLRTDSEAGVAAMVDGLRLFGIGASFGGFESLVVPARPLRTAVPGRPPGFLLRLHVGLESVDDLLEDLAAGFARLNGALAAEVTR
jgi:cystathionine beta-lyase